MSNTQTSVFGRRRGGLAPARGHEYVPAGQPIVNGFTSFDNAAEYSESSPTTNVIKRPVKGARFLSGIVDYIIIGFIGSGTLGAILGISAATLTSATITSDILNLYLGMAIMSLLYGTIMEACFQGTVGKMATGTVVVNEDGSAMSFGKVLGRNLAKFVSMMIPFGISYFMVLWTKDNQTLHDMMVKSYVYRKAKS